MKLQCTLTICVLLHAFSYSQNIDPTIWHDSLQHINQLESEDRTKVQLWNKLAEYHKFTRPDSGIYYSSKALELSRSISFNTGELWALAWLALSHQALENYTLAVQVNLEGLRKAEQWGSAFLEGIFLMDLGICYLRAGNFERALSSSQRAYLLFRSLESLQFSAISASTIGRSYIALDNIDSAFFYGHEAIRLAKLTGINYFIHWSLSRIAETHRDINSPDSALYYFQKSIVLNEVGSQSEKSYDALEIAKLFKLFEQNDSSIYYAEESLQIALENSLYQQVADAGFFLSDFYEIGDPSTALRYSKIAIIRKDSLEKMRTMVGFTDLIDFDEQQRREAVLATKEEFENRLRLNILLGSSFTFLLVAIFLYRNSRQKQKAKQKIEVAYDQLRSTQAQLIQSEKMASLGELTAGIAHEIQNPLNFVNNFSDVSRELLLEMKEDLEAGNHEDVADISQDLMSNLEKIRLHGDRAAAIVRGMLLHSRSDTGEREPSDINALCDEYLRLAYHGLRARNSAFNAGMETDFEKNLPKIEIVPQEMGRVLLNLITNAFYAVHERDQMGIAGYQPKVTIGTRQLNGKIQVIVSDNGPGISEDIKDKIFQPFFTTKPSGQGTGLGLSLSYDIVKAYGGSIEVNSRKEEGTIFTISIPAK